MGSNRSNKLRYHTKKLEGGVSFYAFSEGKNMSGLSIKIVWFPNNMHSEIAIGDAIHYFIGGNDQYSHQRHLDYTIANSNNTPVVEFAFSSFMDSQAIYQEISKQPPSKLNTCMGTVAEIAAKISKIQIPDIIRQSPELSAVYLMLRSYQKGDVSFNAHGISKISACVRGVLIATVQLAAFAMPAYGLIQHVMRRFFEDPQMSSIN